MEAKRLILLGAAILWLLSWMLSLNPNSTRLEGKPYETTTSAWLKDDAYINCDIVEALCLSVTQYDLISHIGQRRSEKDGLVR
jgi:hypothetical protein